MTKTTTTKAPRRASTFPKTSPTDFSRADGEGFIAATAAETSDIIARAMSEKLMQKGINRAILVSATKRQIREAGNDVLRYTHFLDGRGRDYAHGAGLAPQGKDFGRGVLQAADGKRLGVSGFRFLCIGVATTWGAGGIDKAPLRERVRAVIKMVRDGSLARIVHGARNGTDYTWRLAEEPVQFVALAADLLAALESGNAFDHVSAVFIGLDATCSGLQILAAITGCTDTARLVNVAPRADGKRADIYLSAAAETGAECSRIAAGLDVAAAEAAIAANESGDHWALFWARSGKLGRKTFKNPVMVYCYGGGKATFANSFREETKAPWKACYWLAAVLYDTVLASMLPRAHAWMKTAQEAAKTLAKAGKPVAFDAADGLPFVQARMEEEKARAWCHLNDGSTINTVLRVAGKALDAGKQASGIAPNIVHHWDSLFLRNVVRAFKAAGIQHFFTVHDCFYLRAGDWAQGWQIVRRVFVETFQGDVAADLWERIEARANGEDHQQDAHCVAWAAVTGAEYARPARSIILPALPAKGDLDLGGVMRSEFLFS
jgi:DNA-directed RNA polymerase